MTTTAPLIYNISLARLMGWDPLPTKETNTFLINIVDVGAIELFDNGSALDAAIALAYKGPRRFVGVVTLPFLDLDMDDPAFEQFGINLKHADGIIFTLETAMQCGWDVVCSALLAFLDQVV